MRFVCFEDRQRLHAGIVNGNRLVSLETFESTNPNAVNHLIGRLHEDPDRLRIAAEAPASGTASPEARLIAPVPAPQKIFCIGRNYSDHAAEMGASIDELPVVFNKLPSAIIGPDEPVRLPDLSKKVDFEAELVVVLGRKASRISEHEVSACIFGYCCGNDITARDWQKESPGGQWLLGKSIDSFAPIGPWIVTGDQLDAENLDIRLRLNGDVMQSANTRSLIFSVRFLVSYLSRFCTLQPGDLLLTGTPGGVGSGRNPPVFLQSGDQLAVEIEGIGCLTNPVV